MTAGVSPGRTDRTLPNGSGAGPAAEAGPAARRGSRSGSATTARDAESVQGLICLCGDAASSCR
jgi:hypothetical protein